MTWKRELQAAADKRARELAKGWDGLDGLWIFTADIGIEDLNPLIGLLLSNLLDASLQELLDGGKGIVVYAGHAGSVCALLVDLDAEVMDEPNPRHQAATWYPEGGPLPQWFGPRGERPVAAHVLAYAADRDEAMDRATLRGSVE